MIVGECQTNLFLHLEATTRSKKYDIGRLEGVAGWQGYHTVVETSFKGRSWWASDREVPLEGLDLKGLRVVIGRRLLEHVTLLFLDALHCHTLAAAVHFRLFY